MGSVFFFGGGHPVLQQGVELQQKQNLQHKGYVRRSENKPVIAVQETIQKDEEGFSETETWRGKDPPVRLDNSAVLNDLKEKFKYLPVREREESITLIQKYKELVAEGILVWRAI